MKKNHHLQKQIKFHCFKCQTIYQLIEIHSQISSNCSEKCQTRWQTILHDYYQEKILAYIAQQEEKKEKEWEEQQTPDWLKKSNFKHAK